MKIFAKWFAMVSCAFVVGVGILSLLPDTGHTQGGGFPSYPSFSGISVNAPTGGATTGNVNITGNYQVNGTNLAIPIGVTTLVAYANAGSNRTSTTTISCDANLTITTAIANKVFDIRGTVQWTQGASSGGMQANIVASGTGATVYQAFLTGSGYNAGIIAPVYGEYTSQGPTQSNLSYQVPITNGEGFIHFEGQVITGSSGGTFCFSWAQNTSSATGTFLNYGSLIMTQVD